MKQLVINGEKSLFGTYNVPCAKNSVLPIIAASVLCSNTVVLEHIPLLADVLTSVDILKSVGVKTELVNDTLTINANSITSSLVPPSSMSKMRSSVFYLAPLLARTGHAEISRPGGCNLGPRPIDIHLDGLAAMGAFISIRGNSVIAEAKNGLHGIDFTLRYPSVGATETLVMAASLAHGTTILRGVAIEPEVCDLVRFLCLSGAKISGVGTRTLRIIGQENLFGTKFTACPDRIAAATVMCAVAGCGGEVLLENIKTKTVKPIVDALLRAGCSFSLSDTNSIVVASNGALHSPCSVTTGVYPAFPTDAAPIIMASFLKIRGRCSITDSVFSNRFACVQQLQKFGARIKMRGCTAEISGVDSIFASKVCATDLRGGAAVVIAALMANGKSEISDIYHIERGYQDIAQTFSSLGANISYFDKIED